MIGNALLLALTLFVAFCFLLMDRLKFLVPYRQAIFHNYGWAVALYGVLLFGNARNGLRSANDIHIKK